MVLAADLLRGSTSPALRLMMQLARTLEHRPGGKDHDQSVHGRKGAVKAVVAAPVKAAKKAAAAPRQAGPKAKARPKASPGRVSDEDFTAGRGGEKSSKKLSSVDSGSHVELLTFEDGSKAIYKKSKSDADVAKQEFDAEQLGVHVAEALGLTPPRMHRTEDDTAFFDFVDSGRVAASIPEIAGSDSNMSTGEYFDSKDGRRIGLLDALLENPDRHQGNWIVQDDGSITPIDHGLSWEAASDAPDLFPPERATGLGGFTAHYIEQAGFGSSGKWRDNDLSPAYVEQLRLKLEALRPTFEAVGQPGWHDRLMARLDIIASHAKGTVKL